MLFQVVESWQMWRALFLALGVFTLVMGIEGLLIERFTINWNQDTPTQQITDHTLSIGSLGA